MGRGQRRCRGGRSDAWRGPHCPPQLRGGSERSWGGWRRSIHPSRRWTGNPGGVRSPILGSPERPCTAQAQAASSLAPCCGAAASKATSCPQNSSPVALAAAHSPHPQDAGLEQALPLGHRPSRPTSHHSRPPGRLRTRGVVGNSAGGQRPGVHGREARPAPRRRNRSRLGIRVPRTNSVRFVSGSWGVLVSSLNCRLYFACF